MNRREFLRRLPRLLAVIGISVEKAAGKAEAVLINRFSVAGFRYYEGPRLLPHIKAGHPLRLVANPSHPHDEFAVAIYWKRFHIGYVPRSDNRHISRMLQKGIPLEARIMAVEPEAEPWQQVKVGIWLNS